MPRTGSLARHTLLLTATVCVLALVPVTVHADEATPAPPPKKAPAKAVPPKAAPPEAAPPKAAPLKKVPTWEATQKLARQGNLPRAIVAARAVMEADPANVAAARLLQDLLRELGKTDDAAKAVPTKASDLVRRGLLARVMEGNPKKAVAELTAVLREDGAPAIFQLDLAHALVALDRASSGESEATRYVKEHPGDVVGLTSLGHILVARDKAIAARKAFDEALEPDPGLASPAIGLARLHAAEDRPEDSRAVLGRALAVYPRNPSLLMALAEDQIRAEELDIALRTLGSLLHLPAEQSAVHVRMAEVHRLRTMLSDAERCARLALTVKPQIPFQRARALRVIGFVKQKADDLPASLEAYEKAAEAKPDWATIHVDVALVQLLMGKHLFAERTLKKAFELDEDHFDAHLTHGVVQFFRQDTKLAKKELAWALKRDKDNIRANRYMGYVLLDEGKGKNALRHFLKIAELDEKDSSCMRMAGRCHILMGRIENAIEAFREAIARNPKDGWAYFDLGRGFEKQEKWEDAAAAYRKSIELDKKISHPHLYLAELLDGILDEEKEAIPHYKAYLELGGHKEGGWIKKRIEQLERD